MAMKRSIAATLMAGSFLFSALVIVACGGGGDGDSKTEINSGTLLANLTIVDTRDGTLHPNMAVVIDNGKIQKIDLANKFRVGGSAQLIDAAGKFLVPGFLDMHTHLQDSPVNEQPWVEQLLIANGITGIREMRGSPDLVKSTQQINADSAAGRIVAPEILIISGSTIGLNAPPAAAISASAAVQEVQAQKAYGAGFIKTTNATRDAALAFLAEAKNQGLYVAGHLNPSLSAKDASNAGWRAIEHLGSGMGTLLACSTDEDSVRAILVSGNGVVPPPNPPSWSANVLNAPLYQRVFDTYDAGRCQSVAQTFAKNATWHAPTLIRLRTQRFLDDPLYSNDPNLIYVSKATKAAWLAAAATYKNLPASAVATFHQYFSHELSLPLLLKQNGVQMLAGSDTAVIANFVIPGFSLHQEFALLSASGLSPLDILQMTTLKGAQFLNREATMGTVDEGKNADLVLLDANPIADVSNLDKISGVVLKGKYYSKAALDKFKSDVAAAYASQALQAFSAAPDAIHVD